MHCFHLDRELQILVTGSADGIVRLWNPVVTKTPMTSLFGHKYAIEDVRILRARQIVLSISLDAVSVRYILWALLQHPWYSGILATIAYDTYFDALHA